jgi:hypothetical protein
MVPLAAILAALPLPSSPPVAGAGLSCKPPPSWRNALADRQRLVETTLAKLQRPSPAQRHTIMLRPAPDGDDSPIVEAALRAARDVRSKTGQPTTLWFEPGRYRFSRPIALNNADSGVPGAPLVFAGAPGGAIVLTGGKPLQPQTLPAQLAELIPDASRPFVASYSVPRQAAPSIPFPRRFAGAGLTSSPSLFLFQGHRPLWRSLWPKDNYAVQVERQPQSGPAVSPTIVPVGAPQRLIDEPALQAGGYWTFDWAYEENSVGLDAGRAADSESPVFLMPQLATRYAQSPQMRYRFLGGFSFLDAPGGMAYFGGAAAVYPWPGSDPVEAAVLDRLVTISKAHDIRFDGIAFEGARHDLVTLAGARDITFSNSYFGLAAGSGVKISRSDAVVIARSVISDLGEAGVAMVADAQGGAGNVVIADNIITRTGALTRSYQPAVLLNGHDNTVMGNAISDLPHAAIIFAGLRNVMQGNEISAVDLETADAGAIYAFHNLTTAYNVISQNFFHDIKLKAGLEYAGHASDLRNIYLDSWTSFTDVSNNLSATDSIPFWINGGFANRVTDNVWYLNGSASGAVHDISFQRKRALGSFVFDTPQTQTMAACRDLAARFGSDFLRDGKARGNVIRKNFNIDGRTATIPADLARFQRIADEREFQSGVSGQRRLAELLEGARRLGAPIGSSLAAADRAAALAGLRYRGLAN